MRWATSVAATVTLAVLATGCTELASDGSGPPSSAPSSAPSSGSPSSQETSSEPATSSAPPPVTATSQPQPRVGADDVRGATAWRAVEVLAGRIGPRPGHSPAYFRAAGWVQRQLRSFGWQVERQTFSTPGGVSWGIPVEAGPSVNLIASRGDVRPGKPWLALGAHLDTVPQAPGAEDNASGIGVLLALAEAIAERRTRLPVVLLVFGSEEPRGPSDDDHHYGSRAYVESLTSRQRRSLKAMVALDRVGVGDVMPVGSPAEANRITDALRRAARAVGVPTTFVPFQRSSDHWSFARDGLPGVRLGSTPYAAYHSADDVPRVIDRAQLRRAARLLAQWLR